MTTTPTDPAADLGQPDATGNVTVFPVKARQKPEDLGLFLVEKTGACQHSSFRFNDKEETVSCNDCGVRLNPMYVIKALHSQETRWHLASRRNQTELKQLKECRQTACEHCGKTTKITLT